jgi:LmbE family N-acetylglucosaminyl deacetylase
MPDADLKGRTVLAVFAHPDDESLACGGTLARLSDAGARIVLLCATQGRRGSIGEANLVPDGDLGRARAAELQAAAKVLGIAEVILLDYPDGNLRWAYVPELHAEIVAAIREHRADAVITFAEDGLYWHFDHVGVHERSVEAVESLGDAAPSLYGVTMPLGVMTGLVRAAMAKGWSPPRDGFWSIEPAAFGILAPRPSLVVDVTDYVPRKLAALLCHKTQLGTNNPFSRIDAADARRLLGTEQFCRANPHIGCSLLELLGTRAVTGQV